MTGAVRAGILDQELEELFHSLVLPGTTSSNIMRPAVSRMMAWLVNHQFMLRVPPAPWCSPGGRGETDVAVADGFGLAAAGLADDDVPGEGVEVLAGGAELGEAALELLAELVEGGAACGLADAVGRHRRVRQHALFQWDGGSLGPLEERPVGDQEQGHEGRADQDDQHGPAVLAEKVDLGEHDDAPP